MTIINPYMLGEKGNGRELLSKHQKLVDSERAYWNLGRSDRILFKGEQNVHEGSLTTTIRPIEAVPMEERAVMIDLITEVYAKKLLRLPEVGQRLAEKNSWSKEKRDTWEMKQREMLLADNVIIFPPNSIIGEVVWSNGSEYLVGTIGAIPGNGNRRLVDTVGYDGVDKKPVSSLATNRALTWSISDEMRQKYDDIREKDCFDITRLCRAPKSALALAEIPQEIQGRISLNLYEGLGTGLMTIDPRRNPVLIFNSGRFLIRFLEKYIGVDVIAPIPLNIESEEKYEIPPPVPTLGILETIHAHHFSDQNEEIGVAYVRLQTAMENLEKNKGLTIKEVLTRK